MPRDSSGNYTLPAGNPVVTGTPIASDGWANPTLSDVAAELTNSLDRNGRGGMLAPFTFVDGSVGSPGITWTSETATGFYRNATADMRVTVGGVDKFRWVSAGAQDLRDGEWNRVASEKHFNSEADSVGLAVTAADNSTDFLIDGDLVGRFFDSTSNTELQLRTFVARPTDGAILRFIRGSDGENIATIQAFPSNDNFTTNGLAPGGRTTLRQRDVGDTTNLIGLEAVSSAETWIGYNGLRAISTTDQGAEVRHPTGINPRISFQTSAGSEVGRVSMTVGGNMNFDVNALVQAIFTDTFCALRYAEADAIRTTNAAGGGTNSGGEVADEGGTFRAIGYNEIPRRTFSVDTSITTADCGRRLKHSSGTPHTVTVNTGSLPGAGAVKIVNGSSTTGGTLTINLAPGVSMRWATGFSIEQRTGTSFTLQGGGFCLITSDETDSSVFEIEGSGIS